MRKNPTNYDTPHPAPSPLSNRPSASGGGGSTPRCSSEAPQPSPPSARCSQLSRSHPLGIGIPTPFAPPLWGCGLLRAALPAAAFGRVFSVAIAALRHPHPQCGFALSHPCGFSSRGHGLRPRSSPPCAAASGFPVASCLLLAYACLCALSGAFGGAPDVGGLASLFVCVSCSRCGWCLLAPGCPPIFLGRFGFPCRWRPAPPLSSLGRLADARAPSPAAALRVGRVGFPPFGRLAAGSPLSPPLGTAVGLPSVGFFFPAVAGLVSFSPFRLPPACSLRCACALSLAGALARVRSCALGVRPLSPHLGGSAPPLGCPLYLSLRCLAPSGRCAVTRLRFLAPPILYRFAVPLRGSVVYGGVGIPRRERAKK